jgi:hypothetical protein
MARCAAYKSIETYFQRARSALKINVNSGKNAQNAFVVCEKIDCRSVDHSMRCVRQKNIRRKCEWAQWVKIDPRKNRIAVIHDRSQGLFFALSGGNNLQRYRRHSLMYLFIRLFCSLYTRFCCLSCETRRDLDEVARTSHTQSFLDSACLCGHIHICL